MMIEMIASIIIQIFIIGIALAITIRVITCALKCKKRIDEDIKRTVADDGLFDNPFSTKKDEKE